MVRRLEKLLHFVVHINHVRLSFVDVVFEIAKLLVLEGQLSLLVLRLVFRMLDDSCYVLNLFILITNFLLLKRQDPLIFKITSLIKFTVLTSHEPFCLHVFVLLGFVVFNSLVLGKQLVVREFLELLDFL